MSMIFGKIDYINLLPFNIYIKKNIKSTQIKSIINYKKSYPANINKKYRKKQIDSAFISSIASRNQKCLDLGIIAKREVNSVLVIKGENKKDNESETSNALAKVLKIDGQVIIGDKALRYYHNNPDKEEYVDLAKEWVDKYNLPFVFARLCFNKNEKYLKKCVKNFDKRKIKIPRYILKQYAQRSGISEKNILEYLKLIDYKMGIKEKKSLKLFLKLTKEIK